MFSSTKTIIGTTAMLLVSALAMAGADQDGDGVPDSQDNCLEAANSSQLDSNGDGYGNACDPDLNNDGIVNSLDLQMMRDAFFSNPASPNWNPDADLDGSNVVNYLDLLVMRQLFFSAPGPTGFVRWINPASGDWNDPTNWLPDRVPVAEDGVLIDVSGIVVVHFAGDNTCASVISTADILLTGGSRLTVDGEMDIRGSLTITDTNTTLRNAAVIRTIATEGAEPLTVGNGAVLDNVSLGVNLTIQENVLVDFINGLYLDNASLSLMAEHNAAAEARFFGTQTILGIGEILYVQNNGGDNRLYPGGDGDVLTIGPGITVRTLTGGGFLGTSDPGRGLTLLGDVVVDVAGLDLTVVGDPLTVSGDVVATADGDLEIDGNWTATADAAFSIDGDSRLELYGVWVNHGAISVINGVLDIGRQTSSDFWTNLGTIDAFYSDVQLGGVFALDDLGVFATDANVIVNGHLDNTGLTLDLSSVPGTWELGNSGKIIGGTVGGTVIGTHFLISGNADLDGVTLAVDTTIANGAEVHSLNDLYLDDISVTLMGLNQLTDLGFLGEQTLGGSGEILFGGMTTSSSTLNRILPLTNGPLTIGPHITIRSLTSAGSVGSSSANRTTILLGTIISDLPGEPIEINGHPFTNRGTIVVDSGATVGGWTEYVQGASGRLQFNGSGTDPGEFGRFVESFSGLSVALGGMLDIAIGYSPSPGDTFEIISADSVSGTFQTVNGSNAGNDLTFVPVYNADNVTLVLQ